MPVSPLETNHRVMCVSPPNFQHLTSNLRSSLNPLTSTLTRNASATPLASTLTRKLHFKPFRINTYKKGGRGVPPSNLEPPFVPYWPLHLRLNSATLSIRRPRRGSPAMLGNSTAKVAQK